MHGSMNGKQNNVGQTVFICFGGLLIGGLLGALAGVFGLSALLPKSNNDELGEGFGLAIAIMFAGIAGLVVGGIIGIVLCLFLARRQNLRIYLTGVSLLACSAGLVGVALLVREQSAEEIKAAKFRNQEQARLRAAQTESDADQTAYLKEAPLDVPPLLGNLYYPNATILASDRPPDASYSLIILTTKDNLNTVSAFYQNLVPGGASYNHSSRGNSYEVKAKRPGDGKPIEIDVESDYASETHISFSIDQAESTVSNSPPSAPQGSPSSEPQPAPVYTPAWPKPFTPVPYSAPDPAFLQAYGSLAYPNAIETLVAPNPPRPDIPYSNCLQATMDPFAQVIQYYRSKSNLVSETDTLYTGKAIRQSDGQLITVTIRTGALKKTYISLIAD
jgi:hypothetical protein